MPTKDELLTLAKRRGLVVTPKNTKAELEEMISALPSVVRPEIRRGPARLPKDLRFPGR